MSRVMMAEVCAASTFCEHLCSCDESVRSCAVHPLHSAPSPVRGILSTLAVHVLEGYPMPVQFVCTHGRFAVCLA